MSGAVSSTFELRTLPGGPVRFGLRIPSTWFEFDVGRAVRTGELTRLLDERIREFPALRPQRARLLQALRQVADEATRSGAVYAAACADDIDEDGHLLASLTVFVTAGMPEPILNTVQAIAAQITARSPTEGTPFWRQVHLVSLEASEAVRVRGVEAVELKEGTPALPVVTMQTLIPVPDSENVLNIVCASPQTDMLEPLLNIFEAISDTLAWLPGLPVVPAQ